MTAPPTPRPAEATVVPRLPTWDEAGADDGGDTAVRFPREGGAGLACNTDPQRRRGGRVRVRSSRPSLGVQLRRVAPRLDGDGCCGAACCWRGMGERGAVALVDTGIAGRAHEQLAVSGGGEGGLFAVGGVVGERPR